MRHHASSRPHGLPLVRLAAGNQDGKNLQRSRRFLMKSFVLLWIGLCVLLASVALLRHLARLIQFRRRIGKEFGLVRPDAGWGIRTAALFQGHPSIWSAFVAALSLRGYEITIQDSNGHPRPEMFEADFHPISCRLRGIRKLP